LTDDAADLSFNPGRCVAAPATGRRGKENSSTAQV